MIIFKKGHPGCQTESKHEMIYLNKQIVKVDCGLQHELSKVASARKNKDDNNQHRQPKKLENDQGQTTYYLKAQPRKIILYLEQ